MPGRYFFVCLAFVMLAILAVGFGPTLYLRPMFGTVDRLGGGGLPVHLLVHGVVLTAWYVLFAAQTLLVNGGRSGVHRRLGLAGAGLAVAVVVSSAITMGRLIPRATAAGFDPAVGFVQVVVGDFWGLVVFSLLVGAAIHFRRRPETHKRLMLLASLILVRPAFSLFRPVGRALAAFLPAWVRPSLLFVALGIAALVWYDLATKRRLQPATLWGASLIAAAVVITGVMAPRPVGAALAYWFSGLAGAPF